MHLLSRLGYATTRQIAVCLFGGCSVSERKQASRTLSYLIAGGYLVEKRNLGVVSGERMVALTRSGVLALGEHTELMGHKHHARDWLRHAHSHRTACNSVWAACFRGLLSPGWTELEIRSGLAPEALAMFNFKPIIGDVQQKIPDLLLTSYCGATFPTPIWVEVENTWRNGKDLRKLISFLRAMFYVKEPPISQVWFIVTSSGAIGISKRLRAAMAHGPKSEASLTIRELDSRIIEHHVRFFEQDHLTLDLHPILK